MGVSDKKLVVQHNRIIEARYRLSVGEQRLMKLLISMIEKDDEDFKVYPIEIKALYELLGISDKDFYGKIKDISKKLISNVLIFRNLDNEELQVSWLSSAKYLENQGIVELRFSPELKPFLLQLKNNITYYKLANIIYLKHAYSIRIYELLKQYVKIGRRKFEIQEFRKTIGVEDYEYRQFSDFRKRVLKAAQQELNEKTDISFDWIEEKKRQKCIAIEFIILTKNSDIESEVVVPKAEPPAVAEIPSPSSIPEKSLLNRLQALGVAAKTAKALIKNHALSDIQSAIAYTETQQAAGKVKNSAGFVVEAIKNGYTPPVEKPKTTRKKVENSAPVDPLSTNGKVDNIKFFAEQRKRLGDRASVPPDYEQILRTLNLW